MATSKDVLDDAELAKSYITNSSLSDEYKRVYLRLINVSTLATNGISPEEKIQKMTECIQLLAVTQGMYLANIDSKIEKAINIANSKQCENCKAMKHANDIEEEKKNQEIIQNYLDKYGIQQQPLALTDCIDNKKDMTWVEILKTILVKPYIYVVLGLIVVSPYGVEIVKTLCEFFNK